MKSFEHIEHLKERALLFGDALPSGNLYAALSIFTFDDADLSAVQVSDLTSFVEYDGSGYGRLQITSLAESEDGPSNEWRTAGDNLDFGILDAASAPVQWLLLYLGTSTNPADDGTAYPRAVFDNVSGTAFPFNGDGIRPVRIKWDLRGLLFGPNCA